MERRVVGRIVPIRKVAHFRTWPDDEEEVDDCDDDVDDELVSTSQRLKRPTFTGGEASRSTSKDLFGNTAICYG